jgi:hypothetical protein
MVSLKAPAPLIAASFTAKAKVVEELMEKM